MEGIIAFLAERSSTLTGGSINIALLEQILLFIVLIPLVITLLGVMRYIVGFRTLSVYAPLLLTYLFFKLSFISYNIQNVWIGLILGISFFTISLVFSTIFFLITKNLRLHYIPKLSLIVTGLTGIFLIVVILGAYLEISNIIEAGPLTLVIAVVLGEAFMAIIAKKNAKIALTIAFETLIISIICYIFISISVVQEVFYRYPLAILIMILLNLGIGRFLGLRLIEYWRFRKLIFKKRDE